MEIDIASDFEWILDIEIDEQEWNIASIQEDKENQENFLHIIRDEALATKESRHNRESQSSEHTCQECSSTDSTNVLYIYMISP